MIFNSEFSIVEMSSAIVSLLAFCYALIKGRGWFKAFVPFVLCGEEISYGLIFLEGRHFFFRLAGKKVDALHDFVELTYFVHPALCAALVLAFVVLTWWLFAKGPLKQDAARNFFIAGIALMLVATVMDLWTAAPIFMIALEEVMELIGACLIFWWVKQENQRD